MVQPNFLLFIFLVFFILRSATQILLNRLNVSHLRNHGQKVPEIFHGALDAEKLKKIFAYTMDSSRFGILSTLASQAFLLVLLLSGFLPWLAETIVRQGWGTVPGGLFFFACLGILTSVFQLPFNLYDTFVIENRYGFNTKTFRLWLMDLVKTVLISAVLGGFLLGLLLSLILHGGKGWWFWTWSLVGLFQFMMIWLYPVLLAPIFNKFEPVQNQELIQRIRNLMSKAGLRAKGVFQMDASRRSRHTNAYFTGMGKSKRIVLFDTLLQSHSFDEIEAVLAHEVGHWKRRHVLKHLVFAEALSLAGFFLLSRLLRWPLLYETFGFGDLIPYAGLFLAGVLLSPLGYFAHPLESFFSRKFEREADDFVLKLLPSAKPLADALKRLAADNLSNLTPHPLYAWFYYSHPPLVERITRLQSESSDSHTNPSA